MRKGNVLPIAVMAFALVAFLFVLDYSINPSGKWPWSVHTAKNTNAVVSTNTSVNTNLDLNATTASNTNTSTNTNTVSTADWKSYTNTKYGYSIKYPSSYTPSGTDEHMAFDLADYANANVAHLNIFVADGTNDEKFGPTGDGLAVIDWITSARNNFPTSKYMTNKRTTTISREKFTAFDYDLGGSGGSVLYFYKQGSKIFIIQDWPGGAGNPKYNPLASDQVLSTFTFTK